MRVLIVDDDPDCRLILDLMLSRLGMERHFAENGRQGVEAARALQPDLILMDLLMPELTGLEAVGVIRDLPGMAHTPIFAVTAVAFEQERRLALAAGFDMVVTKPFSRRQLMAAIQEYFPDVEVKLIQSA